jgi:type II secretory pathway pseudopilin PulG
MTMRQAPGYMLIMLMVAVLIMGIALLAVAPLWETELQRENEEELIFRGNQYVEAVRLYQAKHPGQFPDKLEKLVEERCLRKLFRDPMVIQGDWNIILLPGGARGVETTPGQESSPQQVLVAKPQDLGSIDNPAIIGVVSSSTRKAFRIRNSQESYDKWLFFYGQDPNKLPEIIYFGKSADKDEQE